MFDFVGITLGITLVQRLFSVLLLNNIFLLVDYHVGCHGHISENFQTWEPGIKFLHPYLGICEWDFQTFLLDLETKVC